MSATTYTDRAHGLPAGYGRLSLEHTATGSHYDYRAQAWRDGHDHAHLVMDPNATAVPPLYCGADLETCQGMTREEITTQPLTASEAAWRSLTTEQRATVGAALGGVPTIR